MHNGFVVAGLLEVKGLSIIMHILDSTEQDTMRCLSAEILLFAGQHSDEEPSETDHLLDTIMLRLRLSDGLDLGMVEAQYGKEKVESITKAIKPHVQQKLVRTFNNSIALADPAGFMLSNDIISDVFAELDQE